MSYVTSRRRTVAATAIAALCAVACAGSATAATTATPSPHLAGANSAPSATTQGIIMRDGGICNPRWGC